MTADERIGVAMIGLGRMGSGMARRLARGGHAVVGYDRDPAKARALSGDGVAPAASLEDALARLRPPRVAWVMVPAGEPTEAVVRELGAALAPGDVVVDGGNSRFEDAPRRAAALAGRGVRFADAGTSGGVHGLERGYCLMVGAEPATFALLEPVLATLAPGTGDVPESPGRAARASTAARGYLLCGPAGAGHFVKMVHNAIEYGLMQAYAEGFELLRSARGAEVPPEHRYAIDAADVAELWRRGSVVGSFLLDLTARALAEDPELSAYGGRVGDSGEGRWAVETAVDRAVPADVLTAALYRRFRSRQEASFADKTLSAMRHAFGGHAEPEAGR